MKNLTVAIISIPVLFIARFFAQSVPYTDQGFFCDDDEIRYPNRHGTVSSQLMQIIYFSAMTILIPLSEISLSLKHSPRIPPVTNKQFAIKTLFFWAAYLCGVLATSLATILFKRTSGRLRPNFVAVCQPKDLSDLCPIGSNAFIENFTCLGDDRADNHYSFPSSHASHSLYFAVFSILYLHKRFRLPNVVRSFVQYTIFVSSIWICLSRVRDFKHRYEDVIGGGILGIVMGIGMIHLVLFNFKHHRYDHGHFYEDADCAMENEERTNLLPRYDSTPKSLFGWERIRTNFE